MDKKHVDPPRSAALRVGPQQASQQRRHFARVRPGGGSRRGGGGYNGTNDKYRIGRASIKKKNNNNNDDHRGDGGEQPLGGGGGVYERYSFDRNDRVVSRFTSTKKQKNILVIGSSGTLGKALVSHFSSDKCDRWNVLGADVTGVALTSSSQTASANDENDASSSLGGEGGSSNSSKLKVYIPLPTDGTLSDLVSELHRGVSSYCVRKSSSLSSSSSRYNDDDNEDVELDAIVVASGGWAGDVPPASEYDDYHNNNNNNHHRNNDTNHLAQALHNAEICERMVRMNYYPVVAGSLLLCPFVKKGGLFVIIGASAALSPTPGMVGYGSSKSAAHHYLRSFGGGGGGGGNDEDITAVGILPLMIDTPANRAMLDGVNYDSDTEKGGGSGYSKMVKPIHIATEIGEWIKFPRLRPHSGSLVKVIAKNRMDGRGGAAFHLVR